MAPDPDLSVSPSLSRTTTGRCPSHDAAVVCWGHLFTSLEKGAVLILLLYETVTVYKLSLRFLIFRPVLISNLCIQSPSKLSWMKHLSEEISRCFYKMALLRFVPIIPSCLMRNNHGLGCIDYPVSSSSPPQFSNLLVPIAEA